MLHHTMVQFTMIRYNGFQRVSLRFPTLNRLHRNRCPILIEDVVSENTEKTRYQLQSMACQMSMNKSESKCKTCDIPQNPNKTVR